MYTVECLDKRAKVFKDGVEYIEMDVTTTCDNFLNHIRKRCKDDKTL